MKIQQLQQHPLGEKGLMLIDNTENGIGTFYKGFTCPLVTHNYTNSFKNGLTLNQAIEYNMTPILYPLSALVQEIEVYGDKFVPKNVIEKDKRLSSLIWGRIVQHMYFGEVLKIEHLPYWIIQLLQSWFINYQGIEAVNPFDLEVNPYR